MFVLIRKPPVTFDPIRVLFFQWRMKHVLSVFCSERMLLLRAAKETCFTCLQTMDDDSSSLAAL